MFGSRECTIGKLEEDKTSKLEITAVNKMSSKCVTKQEHSNALREM